MQLLQATINQNGLKEIKEFLTKNHIKGDNFTDLMILAWAKDAKFQISEGNLPSIEIRAADSVKGQTLEYTITNNGINHEIINID
jgi:hypothetical protein